MAANNGWDQEHVHDVASDYMSVEGSNSHTSPRRFTNPQSYRPRGDFRGKDNWRSRGQNMRSRPYQNRGPPQHQGQFRGGDFRNRPPQNNFWNQRGGPSRGGHFEPRQQNQSFRPQHSFSPRGRFDRGRSGGRGNFRRPYNHMGGGQGFQQNGQLPISAYFHPSMLEDPWAVPESRHQHYEAPQQAASTRSVEAVAPDDPELHDILKEMKQNGDSASAETTTHPLTGTDALQIHADAAEDGTLSEPVTVENDQVVNNETIEASSKDNFSVNETATAENTTDDTMEPPQLIPHETNDPVPHQITD